MNLSVLFPALAAIAIVFVVLPVAAAVFTYYRRPKAVRCPRDGRPAIVRVDPEIATTAALIDARPPMVMRCSFWPARAGCRETCLTGLMGDVLDTAARRH
jgi:hypothetical protein